LKIAMTAELSTTITSGVRARHIRGFRWERARFIQRGIPPPDLHQLRGRVIGVPTSTLARQALAQSHRSRRGQALAGKVGEFGRQPVRFVVPDL
jgi:hypothetical protein